MFRQLKNFMRNQRGNTAIIFTLAAIPLMGLVGMAIDYSHRSKVHTEIQVAIDAAVLATATSTGTDLERKQLGKKIFKNNFTPPKGVKVKNVKFRLKRDGTVVGTVKSKINATVLQVLGFDKLKLVNKAEANTGGIGRAEIVFVLDYSSSMNGQYVEMRDAAISLIDEITKNGANREIKIGLVPFAEHVYATVPGQYVVGGTPGVNWSNCTTDRKWPWVVKDDTPTGSDNSKWGRLDSNETPDTADFAAECTPYSNNSLTVRPLSKNYNGIKNQLRTMRPHAGTNLALGVEFGYQLLSPNAPFTQAVSYSNKNFRKILIVLSDGEHNKEGHGPGGVYSSGQGFSNVDSVCQASKDKGVLVISIAYDLDDADAIAQMKRCASENQYYIEGDSKNIAEKFHSIAGLLSQEAYLSK